MGDGDLGDQPVVERRRGVRTVAMGFAGDVAARHRPGRIAAAVVPRIGLRVALTVATPRPLRLDIRVAQRLQLVLGRIQATPVRPTSRPPGTSPGAGALRIVERIASRCVRADGGVGGPLATHVVRPGAPPNDRVAPALTAGRAPSLAPASTRRVVRRPAGPEPARAPAFQPTPAAAPMAVLGAAELDRVTTRVVETLDRRVSAWRERTGRV